MTLPPNVSFHPAVEEDINQIASSGSGNVKTLFSRRVTGGAGKGVQME